MSDSNMNSVQPSEMSREMVAYLLTASILGGEQYSKGTAPFNGLPRIDGCSKDDILSTYVECLRAVKTARYHD